MSITIPDVPTIAAYTVGSTPQTVFPVPYPFFAATDLLVTVNGAARTLNTHYTVSGAGVTEGGTVTFLAAVTNAEVVIRRDIPVARLTDFAESGPLLTRSLNLELDRIVAIIQQVRSDAVLVFGVPLVLAGGTETVIRLTPSLKIPLLLADGSSGDFSAAGA